VSDGLALQPLWIGEAAAVHDLCQAIPPESSVLIADPTLGYFALENVRGMCGVPAAETDSTSPATLAADVRAVERTGRHLVIFSATTQELASLKGGTTKQVLDASIITEPHTLTEPPRGVARQDYVVYRWEPAAG
jgi:hypothetical protein